MTKIDVLVVDDHSIVRQGLRAFLRTQADMQCIGEARNGHEAVEQARALQPHVILMDLVMPEMDGVAAIAAIKRSQPCVAIIALTTFAEAEWVVGAVQAGADGYLLKDVEVHELARAIHTVHGGQPYLHPEATRHLLRASSKPPAASVQLTARERDVLQLVAHGHSNREIADVLCISEKTASVHVSNILSKFGVASRTQAALYATRAGLVTA
ncbi:MAG TPA: response regulator transcription factor [Roseiflexaceae bacterium]|nr:response regulator transcription factor [Roseiflexaceae bacterium]